MAVSVSGDFVVVWQSYHDGEGASVSAQRFSSSGARLASEFQVNTFTVSHQFAPTVATDGAADFVVAWNSKLQDGSDYGVFARRFSSTGVAQAAEFQVNSYTAGTQQLPSVAASAAGDFVVVWESGGGQDGAGYGVFARRFSSSGVGLGAEFQVNTVTSQDQRAASVAAAASGAFVAVWHSRNQDGAGYGIFGRRFSSSGAPLAAEFQVNEYTTSYQGQPAIAVGPNGDFVVAWQSYNQSGVDYAVFARRFSSAGNPVGSEFLARASSKFPTVAISGGLDFVLAWQSSGGDGDDNGVLARHYSSAGSPLAAEFQVNTFTTSYQDKPAAAADSDGGFVLVWTSNNQDGNGTGIFGQRLAGLAVLDVDGNGALAALSDGLLALRFLFGFTDATLTSGAVGAGCTRCDATAITTYLTGLGLVLDVDGNGSKGALTDGLLALRFLFGFTDTTLTAGAVSGDCTRCDATTIAPYLEGLI